MAHASPPPPPPPPTCPPVQPTHSLGGMASECMAKWLQGLSCVLAAALMGGKGTIWAFDRDAKRLERLKANADTTGATNIVAQQVYTVRS